MRLSHLQHGLVRPCGNRPPHHVPCFSQTSLRRGYMETDTLWLVSAGSLHLQQAEPIAGKGRADLHRAGTGGWWDWRTPRASFIPAQDNVLGS
jgi:hypothetical protein